jgi:hypothetical protein
MRTTFKWFYSEGIREKPTATPIVELKAIAANLY